MNSFNLLLPDGEPSKVWVCDNCWIVARDQGRAERCCTPIPCRFCGEPTETMFNRTAAETAGHDACKSAWRAEQDQARMDRAAKLETWDGWVYEWGGGGPQDGYFDSLESYVDHLVECDGLEPEDWPEWVYVAEGKPGVRLSVGHILENACDDGYDDMDCDLKGVKELTAAIKAFNEANAEILVYRSDCKRAVRVPRPDEVVSEPDDEKGVGA